MGGRLRGGDAPATGTLVAHCHPPGVYAHSAGNLTMIDEGKEEGGRREEMERSRRGRA